MHINIQQFWDWVKSTFTQSYQQEIQAYLEQAHDIFDLEQRMKTLSQRGML